ncbi:hypothetical protein ALC53_06058 [Atta colombica]|uniref:Uncharacterized protein n=1 Tax=Atta colombica TaxID=520822 RepID=A0A195BGP6_9HYME|nr:hypothetical protein ALC53_06058 [Atta colombica]
MNGYDAIMQGRHGLRNTIQPSDTTKGCAEQTRSVPRPFNALVSDVTALELPSILQCYAHEESCRKVVTDRIYEVS